MPDSTSHHADSLRQCIAIGGSVEVQQAGCDSPETLFAGQLLMTGAPDPVARHAIRRARQRALIAAAAADGDMAAAGRLAAEEATLIIDAWASAFAALERAGGHVAYRTRA